MKYYYKVVDETMDGKYESCRAYFVDGVEFDKIKIKRLDYSTKKWTKAPDKINGICIFETLKDAREFSVGGVGTDIIFKCKAKNVRKPKRKMIAGILLDIFLGDWPKGTLHADSIKLIERVES
jgi:hypothetical protein